MPPTAQAPTKDVAIVNNTQSDAGEQSSGGSSTGWWIKWIGVGILVLGLVGLAFYAYKLKGQVDASKLALENAKKESAALCGEFEKLKVEMAKCHTQLEELKKKTEEQESVIEKNKKKNKDLKNKLMSNMSGGNGNNNNNNCDPVTGLCQIPLPGQQRRGQMMSEHQRVTEVVRD